MGYHSNEETTKIAIKDACRFINDRSRIEHGLRLALDHIGISKQNQDSIINDIRSSNFDSLNKALKLKIVRKEQ
jgi:SOS response regulatory protein OraA/RecX